MDIDTGITGKTMLAGLIGNPLEHSVSPQLHNTISKMLGVDLVYVPFRVNPGELHDAVKGLKAVNAVGFNVTIPYKQEILPYLDEISQEALLIGAVNTVKIEEGRLYGCNTDADGFYRSICKETGIDLKGLSVAIIGAGGTARAIAVKSTMEGAGRITIANRTAARAEDIAGTINACFGQVADAVSLDIFRDRRSLAGYDVVINTTSVGMYPGIDASPLEEDALPDSKAVVFDVIYNPHKTKFLACAEKKGLKTVNGLGMLLFQGISAYERWTGIQVPDNVADRLYKLLSDLLSV